ncbi:2-C-methyl-D-erythritol 4-phosphate cytidylyltransferase [Rhodoferax aquaticus]|uniref:2-C-methyl-D-erythritol 4-phosphate cytidylyltransferase n=1 Tax=Rhodoferax aquaticus TaxID=2527691 RepID=A0A515ENM2_9BURK|nr:2-C-methyl-D-erythritol 4-phosphate cytidylyltransferase [Rhodoferax aquaticus]QDL54259.1 2-C-methyl-D-erythritol 4-phosphate cytidylyltransferase [Rhodoferax aquaticus]
MTDTTPISLKNTPPPARLWALIPCAGTGSRSGASGPKQYQSVAGKPMVLHTLQAFADVPRLAGVLVVVSAGDTFFESVNAPVLVAACGGSTRAASVFNGLQALLDQGADAQDWVLVHDAARCLLTQQQVDHLIDQCLPDAVGGLLALKLPDTLKREEGGRVAGTVDRADKWLAQTPQMFRLGALQSALLAAGDAVTDESSAMEWVGQRPLLVEGSAQNFKVTYRQDFALAEAILRARTLSATS